MKGDGDKFEQQIENLEEALVNDILAASDQEILAENLANHTDANAVGKHAEALIEAARMMAGKARMAKARTDATADQRKPLCVLSLSFEEKRRLLQEFATSNEGLRNTLAARKSKDLPENDVDAALEALYELGVIDEHGQAR